MNIPLRYLAMYGIKWKSEDRTRASIILELSQSSGVTPTKVAGYINGNKKEVRRSISKSRELEKILSEFENFESIGLEEPVDGDFRNVKSRLSFVTYQDLYHVIRPTYDWSVENLIDHIELLNRYISVTYGFSEIAPSAVASRLPLGIGVSGFSPREMKLATEINEAIAYTKKHLQGKMIDLFEVNIIGDSHIRYRPMDLELGEFIQIQTKTDLVRIDEDIYVWIVPYEDKEILRMKLVSHGFI